MNYKVYRLCLLHIENKYIYIINIFKKFQDDENLLIKSKMKSIDQVFQDAIIEAAQAHNAYVLFKDKNDAIVAKKSVTVCYLS